MILPRHFEDPVWDLSSARESIILSCDISSGDESFLKFIAVKNFLTGIKCEDKEGHNEG
jgi:hypothetical protein